VVRIHRCGFARLGKPRHGMVWRGLAGLGTAWAAHDGEIFIGADLQGGVWRGLVRSGTVGLGGAWLGLAGQGPHSMTKHSSVRICGAGLGVARRGKAWLGLVRRVKVRRGTFWHGPHKVVKAYRCGFAGLGQARQGGAWLGGAGRGMVWQGPHMVVRIHRCGFAGSGEARRGVARQGTAGQGLARAACGNEILAHADSTVLELKHQQEVQHGRLELCGRSVQRRHH
jgi:hypothetical protein